MSEALNADYLVVGTGAMGMAFVDTLLTESEATVIMVDRYHQPGGHWTTAYPFVRLHQPSAFYGVNSKPLGSDRIDDVGWNQGLYELASNSEVVAYFEQVMNQTFLPSGRVQHFPSCEYEGDSAFKSTVSGHRYRANVKTVVDATYMNVTVPSMRAPEYEVLHGAHCEPLNSLPKVRGQFDEFVVIGAGKTGMDACLFLLKNRVDPDRIKWIVPRDAWYLDRATIQPGQLFASSVAQLFSRQAQDMAEADSIDDLFARVEANGGLLRLDASVTPTMYRCATVTRSELEALRAIKHVIRMGRVQRIEANRILLEAGELETNSQTLHIDCTADGLERRDEVPVFEDGKITLQSVRTCQQVFSAAFIAYVESHYDAQQTKNELATPVPHPNTANDFLRTSLQNTRNGRRWATEAELQAWLKAARLDGFTDASAADPDLNDPEVQQTLAKMSAVQSAAIENLERLLKDAPP